MGAGGRAPLGSQLHSHGNVACQQLAFFKILNLFGPDAHRMVLLDREQIFSARQPWMMIMGKIFPNGVLLMDGPEHKQQRRFMFAGFRSPVLRGYAERLNPLIEAGIANWHQDRSLRAFSAFKTLNLGAACQIFMDVDPGEQKREMNEAYEDMVAAAMSRIRLPIPGTEFHRGRRGRAYMAEFIRSRIAEKRNGEGEEVFSQLCRAKSDGSYRFSERQIVDHMVFLMMAAHDTATSTLTSMTFELAVNPAWQERLREESMGYARNHLSFDDMGQLESLSWVFKETLRRYPPLPVIPRVAEQEFEFEGHRIPKGSWVVIAPIVTHHMQAWWDDPEHFDPERFSPGRAEHERHSHSWIPFGGGPHMCLGHRFAQLQVKTIMHQLLRRYRFSVPEGYRMPVQQAPISKPTDGLPVQMTLLS